MTREEYVKWLKQLEESLTFDGLIDGDKEVDLHEMIFDLCEMLEQQTCEDAISRQAVLDIFADNADATRPYSTAWEKIRDLPPVNPQPKTTVCEDAVSREAVLNALGGPSKVADDDVVKMRERIRIIKIIDKLPSVNPQPYPDSISRSDMLDAIGHGTTYTSEDLQRIIKTLPPVNSQPKMGHWQSTIDGKPICSECGFVSEGEDGYFVSNYCPHCGAKMEVQE